MTYELEPCISFAPCEHCGDPGRIVGGACPLCAVECSQLGCKRPADPGEVGGLCPLHVPPDGTMEIEELPPWRGEKPDL